MFRFYFYAVSSRAFHRKGREDRKNQVALFELVQGI
jgi:hypothetical protein